VLQITFVEVCLPSTGGTPTIRKQKPGEKKGRAPGKLEQDLNSKIVVRPHLLQTLTAGKLRISSGLSIAKHWYWQPAFLFLLLVAFAATPLLTGTLVLFGAPVTTHHSQTLLCGAHLALLSTLPLVYVHGLDGETWRQIVALLLPIDEVYRGLFGRVLGAWFGAVPIPLDWWVPLHLLQWLVCISA
jgi:phosphatidylinositol glycan class F